MNDPQNDPQNDAINDVPTLDVSACRAQFPSLRRQENGREVVFLDGPAGTQTPDSVNEAIIGYLRRCNANHGGLFATSRESDAMLEGAHRAAADLLGVEDAETVFFGANMTSLTFALSRALARTWSPGDEVMVTQLDHDANVTPWTLAARDAGATVRTVALRDDATLDVDDFRRKLSARTRLVAVGAASNATGGVNPVAEICGLAREAGALSFVDAVHFAPHDLIDVPGWGCDFLACSAYKFCGPHIGVMWGRRELLESLEAYKLRPAPDSLPGKWMTGTQSHECLAGVAAAIDYLASLSGRPAATPRRTRLRRAFASIAAYERRLCRQLLEGLAELPQLRIWGESDPRRLERRVPTVAVTHSRHESGAVAEHLSRRGLFVWHGNFYALNVTEALGLEPGGLVRLGLVHYNTAEEVTRLLEALAELG